MSRTKLLDETRSGLRAVVATIYLQQQQLAAALKLHPTDMQCLYILDQTGPLSAGDLAERLGLTSGATTAVVDRLKALGFVQRCPAPADRRCIMIELEPDAMQRLYEHPAEESAVLQQFSDVELAIITRFLQLIAKIGQ